MNQLAGPPDDANMLGRLMYVLILEVRSAGAIDTSPAKLPDRTDRILLSVLPHAKHVGSGIGGIGNDVGEDS